MLGKTGNDNTDGMGGSDRTCDTQLRNIEPAETAHASVGQTKQTHAVPPCAAWRFYRREIGLGGHQRHVISASAGAALK